MKEEGEKEKKSKNNTKSEYNLTSESQPTNRETVIVPKLNMRRVPRYYAKGEI